MTINQYSTPVQNTLESYIPLPLDTLMKAGQAIQQRGDAAQLQNDQFQTGLASMEALAPGHRQYVNKAVDNYKQEQNSLLDKYAGNTSDPDYEREARRVNMKFAADPNLKVIQNTNDLYKAKQKIKDQLDSQGVKYLDSNPTFTGLDSNGNLSNNVGQLRATAFDTNIDKSFKDIEGATEQVGHTITNRNNLTRHQNILLHDLASGNNPDVQDALAYYKQKGMNDHDAKLAVVSHINDGMKYAHDVKDHFFDISPYQSEELKLRWAELADKKAKETKESQVQGLGMINSTQSPFLAEKLGSDKVGTIDKVIGNTNDNGGLRKGSFTVPNTPENRAKYKDAEVINPTTVANSLSGVDVTGGRSSQLKVQTNSYNPDESKLVDEARQLLGDKAKNNSGSYLSDKTILSRYKDILTNSQSAAYQYKQPLNEDYAKALTSLEFGNDMEHLGTKFTVVTKDGKYDSSSKEGQAALKGVKHLSSIGVNSAPVGEYTNGTIAGEGVNANNETVTVVKPLSSSIAQHFQNSNRASSALLSGFTNSELANSPTTNHLKIVNNKTRETYVPQKGLTQDNKIGIAYYPLVDGKVDKSRPINIDQVEAAEHSDFWSRLGQSIGNKPEKQNYSTQ